MKKQEVAAISKEDAEEFSQSLGQIVTGSYRQILLADKMQVPQVLGFSSLREWVNEKIGGYIKYSIEERARIVEELNGEGMTQREIADVLGVAQSTVGRDLKNETNGSQAADSYGQAELNGSQGIDLNPETVEDPSSEELPIRKKSAAEIEVELHRVADQGAEALIWEKIRNRFIPFWEELSGSLDEDERPLLIWAIHNWVDKHAEER